MPAELVLVPEASHDLNAAYEWYEARKVGLGDDFLECVDVCFETLYDFPMIEALIYRSYRRAIVQRFPYGVYYAYSGDVVTVLSVLHYSRDPQAWQRRLP